MKNGLIIFDDGSRRWYKNDRYHREDGPAVEYPNGAKWWYLNGVLHREDGPAVIHASGMKGWYLFREDGPALENTDGSQFWYLNGKFLGTKQPKNWEELVKMARVKMIMEM